MVLLHLSSLFQGGPALLTTYTPDAAQGVPGQALLKAWNTEEAREGGMVTAEQTQSNSPLSSRLVDPAGQ